MSGIRPTIPFVSEMIDVRLRYLGRPPDTSLFSGWGIGLPSQRRIL
ncbi:MAG: hypothetical protein GIW98_05230 [Candidatus Eremiobacteraeota bacterium]|nr:hypothetical protein [Candidatus Eremiobacteraeota bacterium]